MDDLSDFADIERIPAPALPPVSYDPNAVAAELPPRFVELMAQNPR